ncbi:MAG: hypothetical protein RIC93_10500, partial [Alphaproteobacteria bacterium]
IIKLVFELNGIVPLKTHAVPPLGDWRPAGMIGAAGRQVKRAPAPGARGLAWRRAAFLTGAG